MPRGRKVRNTNSVAVWRTNARAPFFFWVDAFFFSVGAFHFFLFFSLTRLFVERNHLPAQGAVGACFLSIYTERKWDAESAINDSLFSREGQFTFQSKKEELSLSLEMIFWKKKKSLSPDLAQHTCGAESEKKKTNRRLTFLLLVSSLSRDAKRTRSGIFVE